MQRNDIGPTAEFETMVRTELPKVFNLCFRLLQNEQEAADLCQDVFVKALRGIQQFRGDSAVSTWLYRITLNTWKNHLRSKNKWRSFWSQPLFPQKDDDTDSSAEPDIPEKAKGPEESMELLEDQRDIKRALDKLDDDAKSIVILKDMENLSYDDISQMLELNIGTVKSRLSRARTALRNAFKQIRGKLA